MPDESRHNPLHYLHKALRHGHCRMLSALGTQDFGKEPGTAKLLSRLNRLIDLNRAVYVAEREILFSVQACCSHAMALAEINSLIRALLVSTRQRKNFAGGSVYRCFALFAAADMARMDADETELLSALHHRFNDQELRAIEMRLFNSLDEAQMTTCMQLLMQAICPAERRDVMAQIGNERALPGLSSTAA